MFEKKFSLKHVIKNCRELTHEFSQKEDHFGVPWYLYIVKEEKHLGVYLIVHKPIDAKSPWSIDVDFKFCLSSDQRTVIGASHQFGEEIGIGWPKFHNWKRVLKNHAIDDCITVVCHVTIKSMSGVAPKRKINFEEKKENVTDMVLKVGEQAFNVNKALLAFRSPYFNTLFFGNFSESNNSEVELKDVDPSDFQTLLDAIYGESVIQGRVPEWKKIPMVSELLSAENVEGVLRLADQFDVALVREKCEEFLMDTDELRTRSKLRLADKYELEKLKRDCVESITSAEKLKRAIPSDLTDLNSSTVLTLLEKCVQLL